MSSPFNQDRYERLLEGLEAREVSLTDVLSNRDFRMDSEFYRQLPPENPKHYWVAIGDKLLDSQYGISIAMNEEGDGFPIYRMNEIESMLCVETVAKTAAIPKSEAIAFYLKDRDVLFNRTNSQKFVGRTGLYLSFDDQPRIFASYLVRLTPNQSELLPEYLVAYLNSDRGVLDVKRRARISINQSNVNPEEVKAVRIPLLSMSFQESIAAMFLDAHSSIKVARHLLSQAEQMLLEELDLAKWTPPEPLTYQRRAKDVFTAGRLDAEHFQPQYSVLREKLQHNANCRKISKISLFCKRGLQPEYVEDGSIRVVNSRHILEHGLDYDNFERTGLAAWDSPRFSRARLKEGDILTYTTGANIGRTAYFHSLYPTIASNHVNILRLKTENPKYVAFVMNSMVGRMQTREMCSGTAQVELYPSDIEQFLIPFISTESQERLVTMVQESDYSRHHAYELLERAKNAVEIAIEDSEAAGLAYLNSEEN